MRRSAAVLIATILAAVELSGQRQPICTPEEIALSYNWREGTSRGCTKGTRDDRCWINAETGAPIWNQENAGCGIVHEWANAPNRSGFVEWLADQKRPDGSQRFNVPAMECAYIGRWEITLPEGQAVDEVRVWDRRDPRVYDTIKVPTIIAGEHGEAVPFTGRTFGVRMIKIGCWKDTMLQTPACWRDDRLELAADVGAITQVKE